jgi:hypothetical protein
MGALGWSKCPAVEAFRTELVVPGVEGHPLPVRGSWSSWLKVCAPKCYQREAANRSSAFYLHSLRRWIMARLVLTTSSMVLFALWALGTW